MIWKKGSRGCDRVMEVKKWRLEAGGSEAAMPVPGSGPNGLVTGDEK